MIDKSIKVFTGKAERLGSTAKYDRYCGVVQNSMQVAASGEGALPYEPLEPSLASATNIGASYQLHALCCKISISSA